MASTFPFKSDRIRESELKEWLTQIIYPQEFFAGGSIKTRAKKRVNSRIHFARKKGVLARSEEGSVIAISFFEWACAQRGWESLAEVNGLPRNATIALTPPEAALGQTSEVSPLTLPNELESSKGALVDAHKRNIELQEKNQALERESKAMALLLEKRQKKADEGREHGRKGRGVKKDR